MTLRSPPPKCRHGHRLARAHPLAYSLIPSLYVYLSMFFHFSSHQRVFAICFSHFLGPGDKPIRLAGAGSVFLLYSRVAALSYSRSESCRISAIPLSVSPARRVRANVCRADVLVVEPFLSVCHL